MMDFFVEGGWGMYPVLALGVVLIGAAGRYAATPTSARLHLVMGVGVALAIAMTSALVTNVAMVMWYLEDPARVPDAQFARILVTGLKESTRPGALGGGLMMLGSVIACIGLHRATLREVPR